MVPVTEWVQVQVPVVQAKAVAPARKPARPPRSPLTNTELQSTPSKAVEAVFDILSIERGDVFMDLGCGDGRLLEVAYRKGMHPIGIELDKARAAEVRKRLRGKATVFTGDVRNFERTIQSADIVYVWLYPELLAQLNFPSTATVVSYSHEIPSGRKLEIDGHTFYVRKASL